MQVGIHMYWMMGADNDVLVHPMQLTARRRSVASIKLPYPIGED